MVAMLRKNYDGKNSYCGRGSNGFGEMYREIKTGGKGYVRLDLTEDLPFEYSKNDREGCGYKLTRKKRDERLLKFHVED